jgi:hypothetical protein
LLSFFHTSQPKIDKTKSEQPMTKPFDGKCFLEVRASISEMDLNTLKNAAKKNPTKQEWILELGQLVIRIRPRSLTFRIESVSSDRMLGGLELMIRMQNILDYAGKSLQCAIGNIRIAKSNLPPEVLQQARPPSEIPAEPDLPSEIWALYC